MEVKLVITVWQLIVAIVTVTGAFAVNTYMTRQNDRKIKALEGAITEVRAREIFVTKELYQSEIKHLNKTLDEVKTQNQQILDFVRK